LLDLVEDLCSHLLILDRGERRFFGPLADVRGAFASLREDESLEEIFFRATEGPTVAPVGTTADEPAAVPRVP
jgi:ABC-2 type transport system ATP-binding protein